jgi:hypothetical protein
MWKLVVPDGRIAWFCGDDPARAREMATELFPGLDVTIEEQEDEVP